MMPKIAIDLRTSYPSGIFRYSSSLLGHLTATLSGAGISAIVLYGPNLEKPQVEMLAALVGPHGAELVFVPDEVNFTRNSSWLRECLIRHDIQLYYSFNYIVDVNCPVPYVFTIYDLIRLKHPQHSYTDESFRHKFGEEEFAEITRTLRFVGGRGTACGNGEVFTKYFPAMMQYLSEHSLNIVTVSEAVKHDIVSILDVSPDKVSVVPGATQQARFHRRQPAEVRATLAKINCNPDDPYCLYVGANLPHKRLPWLIEVLSVCAMQLPVRAKLLVTGKSRAEDSSVKNLIRNCGLEGVVVFTREVTDDDLACLYSGAQALVVTSVDEGFCLPALEALCCGCEAIVPRLEVMSEITSDCAHFYPPHDAEQLAFLLTEAFHDRLPRKAQEFRSRFSWTASAEHLAGILQNLLLA